MNWLRTLILIHKERKARARDQRADEMALNKLAELVAQTRASYKHQRYLAGRKAALKNKPPRLKRIPYAWKREQAR